MARFRLPPPFNDPEDDVVFPQSHGGNFRTPAAREERPVVRSRRRAWMAGLAVFVLIAGVGGLYFMRARAAVPVPTEPETTEHGPPLPGTLPPRRTPRVPILRNNASPPQLANPYVIDPGDGMITLSTDIPARCTIRWVRFQTPVMDESVPAGHHPAECISLDGTRRARFDVTILRNMATPRLIALDEAVYPPQPPPPIGPSPLPRRAAR